MTISGGKKGILKPFSRGYGRKHFYKQMEMEKDPPREYYGDIPVIYDVYKAEDIMNERVYTHFYFNESWLVIDSVHEMDK